MKKTSRLIALELMSGIVFCLSLLNQTVKADFIFGKPEMVPNINSEFSDGSPQISRDGLELYYNYAAGDGQCSHDIWVAKRSTTKEPWSSPIKLLGPVNSSGPQRTPSLSAEGLELYFSDGFPNVTGCEPNPGGHGHSDLWVSTRASKESPWGSPKNLGPIVNTINAEDTPCVSANGLELYYMSNIPDDPQNSQILMTTRPTKDDPWGAPVTLSSNVNSNQYEYTPYISADGLSLFFSRGFSKAHVWVSRRPTITAPWERAELFGPVNSGTGIFMAAGGTDGTEFCVSFSEDDSAIYFTHGDNVFTLDYNIWQVKVTPVLDLNADGEVNKLDLNTLLEHWGNTDESLYDIAPIPFGDGVVNAKDLRVMKEVVSPELAKKPYPISQANNVPYNTLLSWEAGVFAQTHDVYFGTSYSDVNDATMSSLLYMGRHEANTYDPGQLHFSEAYYWRVDEVNGAPDFSVFTGDVWSFTTEPYSIQIPGADIVATASSSSNEFSMPEKTIDGSGLGGDGTHAIASETMWFTAVGDTDAWIQYEFDSIKKLDTMKVWNSNSSAEGFIGYGVKGVEIAYSTDGETWNVLEDANELSRAPGFPTYNQYDEIPFDGVAAKMVRLNIQSNFGGFMQAYSLSEVQFNAIPAAVRQPEPVDGAADVFPNDMASWRAGRGAAQSIVYLSTDPNAVADGVAPSVTSNTNSLDFSSFDLQMGTPYYWRVDEVNNAEAVSVWAGPVWSFSVVAAVVVDDFESYGNDSPDRPFQVWLDGFGYSPDDFFPAGYNGNGTGAGIGHDIWSVSSDHFNGDIMETGSTIPGSSQSMPFYYGNSGGVASQTERTFAVSQDWTMGGAQTLSIPFSGQTGNTGTLYVKINNTKLTYPHGAANIAMSGWQAWNIDLTSMNVQNVTKLQIGVDGGSASGMILIDDITLHPTAGETVNPADPGTANLAGLWNFDAGSGSVVADSSGNGNNGTIEGGSNSWMPGKQGSALSMSINTYVSVPGAAWSSVSTEFTVSFWAKGDDLLADNWGFFAGNADDRIVSCHLPWGGEVIFDTTPGWNTERVIVGASDSELKGQWRHWTFVRNTETGEKQAYLDGLLYGSATPSADPIEDIDRFFIGAGDAGVSPYLGLIDEFQIYNRALSAGEVLWLSGNIAPVDKLF